MQTEGRAWRFADNLDTDGIIPARYLNTSDPQELAAHCMEDADPGFASGVAPGDVVVAGANCGCGSSREHAPIALKAAGVGAVIAPTFARIFFRNAFNIGLPILECPEAVAGIEAGDRVRVDFDRGTIQNLTTGREYAARPIPPFMRKIIECGGLINYVRERLEGGSIT
ncbi:MAG: 3-isopropylmalate dehydratase small subunit [Peptococcaceae bacterium]|jgi:3-isopropylmalate dehydratase small subunit|nr:3-isopropylmalate dehydratase small subunit [Peptococcaceae bacterium]